MITQYELKTLVSYDPETGVFTRIDEKVPRVLNGCNALGYVQMTLRGQFYYGHRLAWFYMYGEWPKYLDHINGIRADNRIANLRAATHSQNMANIAVRRDSRSGIKGIQQLPNGRWYARLTVRRKRVYAKCFGTAEEAYEGYRRAAREHFGDFARV